MKIIFLCGSLEPGRDGVGDYVRRLAWQLIITGHHAGIVALNDQHIKEEYTGAQESDGFAVPVLRLPSHLHSTERFKQAGIWIDDFNPAWLSLQFVPFAFHSKGLVFGMGSWLSKLGNGRKWHIMVHELWVGMDEESPLKFVYWGWLQRQLIKLLFIKLKPRIIHTQANLYIKKLEEIGFKPQQLPLFGNISVVQILNKNNDHHGVEKNNPQSISFIVFGGIHAGARIGELAKELKLYSEHTGIKVVLKMIGRCGAEQVGWEKEWEGAGLTIELSGEQSAARISEELSNSSFGITSTPASLIEKSGSVSAMREHGLTVLCIARSWNARGISNLEIPPGVMLYKQGEIENFIQHTTKSYLVNSISSITQQFVNNLLLSV